VLPVISISVEEQPALELQEAVVHSFHPWDCELQDFNKSLIPPSWLLSGEPVTRFKLLGKTKDKLSYFMVWECGAATFHWHYGKDEFLTIISGEAFLKQSDGAERHFKVGDTAFFPAGSLATWRVPNHVRKIAVLKPAIRYPSAFLARAWMKVLLIIGIVQQPGL
jgi:uncharacterized cupin superfamily protein